MTWSYSGDPNKSPLDKCRFLLGDTDESDPIMQDEEINYLIDKYPDNENQLLYHLFIQASVKFARAIKRSLGPQAEDPTSRTKFFEEQAQYYRRLMSQSSGLTLPKSTPIIFWKGMNDNV